MNRSFFYTASGIKKLRKNGKKITYQAVGMFKKSRKNILILTRSVVLKLSVQNINYPSSYKQPGPYKLISLLAGRLTPIFLILHILI